MQEILGSKRLAITIAVIAGLLCFLAVYLSSMALLHKLGLAELLISRGTESLLGVALLSAAAMIGGRLGLAVWQGSLARGLSMDERSAFRAVLAAILVFGLGSGIANALVLSRLDSGDVFALAALFSHVVGLIIALAAVMYLTAWGKRFRQGMPPHSSTEARYRGRVLQSRRDDAERGDAVSQWALGRMYESGEDVEQDEKEAAKWYRLAADQGHQWAQQNLGLMYLSGRGVARDLVCAHMWFNLASAHDDVDCASEAVKQRNAVAAKMTDAQIAQAVAMATQYKASKFGRRFWRA